MAGILDYTENAGWAFVSPCFPTVMNCGQLSHGSVFPALMDNTFKLSQNIPFFPRVAFFRHFVIATRKASNTIIHFILNRLPSSLTHSQEPTRTTFGGQCCPIWQNSYLFSFVLTISFLWATWQHSVPSLSEVNSSSSRPHIADGYHIGWFSPAHTRFSSYSSLKCLPHLS